MTKLTNVSIIKQANTYFDGNVTSRTIEFEDGSTKSLGIMMPGEYEFGTGLKETMEIMAGELLVSLPGSDEFVPYKGGQSFNVPADSKFQVKVSVLTDYCCSYLK